MSMLDVHMSEVTEPFWFVMRLSNSSDRLQQIDSLPHIKHGSFGEAVTEAARLVKTNPNARGFAILKCEALITPVKENTFSQRLRRLEEAVFKPEGREETYT